jgi:hypothetical protein
MEEQFFITAKTSGLFPRHRRRYAPPDITYPSAISLTLQRVWVSKTRIPLSFLLQTLRPVASRLQDSSTAREPTPQLPSRTMLFSKWQARRESLRQLC